MSDNPNEWTDEQFLQYVETHAETERALFHKDMVVRLLRLANSPAAARDVENGSRRFYSLHTEAAEPYLHRARILLQERERQSTAKVEASRMAARAYQVAADKALES